MPELDARIHAGEQVVDGKLPGSWPKLATSPDVRLSPATASAASRSSPPRATAPATSPIATPATAP